MPNDFGERRHRADLDAVGIVVPAISTCCASRTCRTYITLSTCSTCCTGITLRSRSQFNGVDLVLQVSGFGLQVDDCLREFFTL